MKKYTILGAVFALSLVGCQDNNEINDLSKEVKIDATYPSSLETRVGNNHFEENDQIGFYMVRHNDGETPLLQYAGNYATNIKATYNGINWICAPKVYWENGEYDFYAYYPYIPNPNSTDELQFKVQLDQSSTGFTQSDFLWAKATSVSATDVAIPLKFTHKLSKINIIFAKGEDYTGDLPENADVYIHNTNPNAIIDLNTGEIVCNNRLPVQSIKARCVANTNYEAIIVPQRVSTRVPLIEVIVNNISYLVETKFIFKSQTSHTYKIIMSDNPDNIKIEIGGGIEDWG